MARKKIDWEAIEKEFSLGQKSLRTLATEFNVSPGSISKRSKKFEWVQDKSAEVKQKTRAALIKETLEGNTKGNTPTREDINLAVQTNVNIIRSHRKDISTGRALVGVLYGQLESAAVNRSEIEDDISQETKNDLNTTRRNQMLKAVSLPAHAGVLRDLSTTLKNLIGLERQAFNLDDDKVSLEEVLAALPADISIAIRKELGQLVSS